MQRAAAAERHRDEFRRIVPALDRHQADRAGHAGVRDAHDRGRGIVHRKAERRSDMLHDRALRGLDVERFQFAAERTLRIDAAEHDLRVGQGRPRVALAVAGRPRHRAGAFRADLQQPAAIDPGDRAAARADRGDLDHRGADHEAELDRGLRRDRRLAVRDQRDVERGAAEIAGDEIVEAGGAGERRARDHAGRRAGQRGAHRKPARGRGRHDAAVRLHDVDACAVLSCASACFQLGDVGGDDRLQVGVDRRRGGALELADLGQHLVRGGDVVVRPDLAHRGERALLVLGIGVGIDEDDRDGLRALAR